MANSEYKKFASCEKTQLVRNLSKGRSTQDGIQVLDAVQYLERLDLMKVKEKS